MGWFPFWSPYSQPHDTKKTSFLGLAVCLFQLQQLGSQTISVLDNIIIRQEKWEVIH